GGSAPVPRWLIGAAAGFSIAVLTTYAAIELKVWPGRASETRQSETLPVAVATPVTGSAAVVKAPAEPVPPPVLAADVHAERAEVVEAAPPRVERAPASRLSREISLPARRASEAPARAEVADKPARAATGNVTARPDPAATPAAVAKSAPAPQSVAVATTDASAAAQPERSIKQISPQQRAENEYRRGVAALQQGRANEAQEALREALALNAGHDAARQALLGLLIENKDNAEAERLLRDRLKLGASHPGFAMTLARLQIDRGDTAAAIDTLQQTLPFAAHNAEYVGFLAAALARASRHAEAIEQYQAALRANPNIGVWWMGLGLSLQALHRSGEAQDAFRRAKASNTLNPDLIAFIDQRLKQLQ
ncbi:MAG TPA: tetratricopeptide repeat protein, partial [Burkholderiales bacterium]|nr:tetratricopeptide repeat protein [Burkholderiales bacterium]